MFDNNKKNPMMTFRLLSPLKLMIEKVFISTTKDTFNRQAAVVDHTIPRNVPYTWPGAAEGFRDQLQSFKKLLIAIYLWMALIRLYLLHSKAINIQLMRCAICHPTNHQAPAPPPGQTGRQRQGHFIFSSTGPLCVQFRKTALESVRTGQWPRLNAQHALSLTLAVCDFQVVLVAKTEHHLLSFTTAQEFNFEVHSAPPFVTFVMAHCVNWFLILLRVVLL